MKVLSVIAGPISLKDVDFVRSFVKQIDPQIHQFTVLGEELNIAYFEKLPQITRIKISKKNFNLDVWKSTVQHGNFDILIVINLSFLLFDDSKIIFKKEYLKKSNLPTFFFITDNTLKFKDNQVYLDGLPKNSMTLSFPSAIIAACPPHIPDSFMNSNLTTFYWKNLEDFAFLGKSIAKSNLEQYITNYSKTNKIIFLYFDLEQVLNSISQELQYHYATVINIVYYYLSSLNIECNLLVGNFSEFDLDEVKDSKVNVNFFSYVTDDIKEEIVRSSDLILTESIDSFILIPAANLKVPVINLKSTVGIEEVENENGDKNIDVLYDFDNLSDYCLNKIQDLLAKCPKSVYPYYSFPNVAQVNIKYVKVFGNYIFNFTDLFDKSTTIKMIDDLLNNEEAIKSEKYRIEQYLELRSEAQEAQELLDSINIK